MAIKSTRKNYVNFAGNIMLHRNSNKKTSKDKGQKKKQEKL